MRELFKFICKQNSCHGGIALIFSLTNFIFCLFLSVSGCYYRNLLLVIPLVTLKIASLVSQRKEIFPFIEDRITWFYFV